MDRYSIATGKKPAESSLTVKISCTDSMPLPLTEFKLTPSQMVECMTWCKKHKCIHSDGKRLQYTYSFCPTSTVGVVVQVKCICGKNKTLANTESKPNYEFVDICTAENLDQVGLVHGMSRITETDEDFKKRIVRKISPPLQRTGNLKRSFK